MTSHVASAGGDNQNRLLRKATPFGALSYTYDVVGNRLSMVSSNVNGVSVSYTYDELNRLKTVTSDGRTTTYSYDAAGNLSQTAYPNGVRFTPGRDTMYRVTSLPVTSAPAANYSYTYGPVGNRLTANTTSYGYDAIYRLTSETRPNGALSYLLDPVGNRLALNSTLSGIASQSFTYDLNDRIVGNSYDANGNTLASGARTFAYDSANRLKSFNSGAVTMLYDGHGNLVGKARGGAATTFYLVDENNPTGLPQVAEEIVGGVVLRAHTYGLERISQRQWLAGTWQTSYYGYDAHGDVRFLTNSAGAVTDTYDYDAWGNAINVTGVTPNAYLYQGEQFDADTGLYYLRARYFDPLTGRFLTTDPQSGSHHLCLYASGDPVNRFDPTGRQASGDQRSSAGLLIFDIRAGVYLAFSPGPLTWPQAIWSSCLLSLDLTHGSGLGPVAMLLQIWGCGRPKPKGPCPCDQNPPYNPGPWNSPDDVKINNCYTYAWGVRILPENLIWSQPGGHTGRRATRPYTCQGVKEAAVRDGFKYTDNTSCCPQGYHPVILVVGDHVRDPADPMRDLGSDYHWYRQDSNCQWSSKHGFRYGVGPQITDPFADANIWGYNQHCGRICAPHTR